MCRHRAVTSLLVPAAFLLPLCSQALAQGLQITYGSKGIQTLSFNGTTLENVGNSSSDAFHIWHMKSTDLSGNLITTGQYGWGENNSGTSWNPSTQTETYNFVWGNIATQFAQHGNNLDITVTETNYGSSGIIFDGAEIFPFFLHFPQDPAGFSGYTQYAITNRDPGVSVADFGSGVVTAVLPNEATPMYTGWKTEGNATYSPIMTSTAPDYLATFYPRNDHPVMPGTSFSYTVSLRFTPEGTAADASDAYASFAATYPNQMTWSDKRIIGGSYLASSPSNTDITQPGGFPTNPRRYFNDPSVDITNPTGLQAFQDRVLAQAANDVTNLQNMDAQGVILWDIEGEQYPQTTSYVCSPDQIAAVAPEMESTITDKNSPFYGQKLDDAYFKTITNAGFRVGVCLRPQMFTLGPNNTASQVYLTTNAAIIANLENKVRYANSRWGTSLFYVDSTVDTYGGVLDAAIFQQLHSDFPNLLFIPEESTTRYYAYTAPFYSFLNHTSLGTPAAVYNVYPHAFGMNLINDVNAAKLAQYTPQLTASVAHGDILMGHADYWDPNNATLVSIYRAAGVTSPTPPATPQTPAITWSTPSAITYGTPLSAAQLNAAASTAGTFTYNPALGSVLSAGSHALQVTFTPADTTHYTSATASVNLTISRATPTVTWATPAAITSGTALSSTQLNATANVPGTFTYSPAAGTVLAAGTSTLTVTFTPTDSTDYTSATRTVNLTINASNSPTPQVTWSAPATITYGTPLSGTQLNATANVAGSFAYSPVAGTILTAGAHTLTAVFTPSTGNSGPITTTRSITVNKATPTLTWATPAPITSGTALSNAQLNASANVPGTYTYTPGAGTVLGVGSSTLSVTFTPSDTTDYTTKTATVVLVINAATPTLRPGSDPHALRRQHDLRHRLGHSTDQRQP